MLPSAPCGVEAIIAMRQVVMESAMRNNNAGATVLVGNDLGIDIQRLGK